jgi:hypothetical protein
LSALAPVAATPRTDTWIVSVVATRAPLRGKTILRRGLGGGTAAATFVCVAGAAVVVLPCAVFALWLDPHALIPNATAQAAPMIPTLRRWNALISKPPLPSSSLRLLGDKDNRGGDSFPNVDPDRDELRRFLPQRRSGRRRAAEIPSPTSIRTETSCV